MYVVLDLSTVRNWLEKHDSEAAAYDPNNWTPYLEALVPRYSNYSCIPVLHLTTAGHVI